MEWKYVDKDGNPAKEGVYFVTLIYSEMGDEEVPGHMVAEVDTRYFGDAEKYAGWIMKDQPNTGLVWTKEMGSAEDEVVWAWAELEEAPFPERLPDGVSKYYGWVTEQGK